VTYGQVAALAGRPGAARQVGYALAALADGSDVPWHRVVNARGQVSRRSGPPGPWEGYQRHLLEEEGVEFDARGSIDLRRFRWESSDPKAGVEPAP
jgi:methylated-DNA-protein-cysteine methyltransferase-like protein